MTRHSDNGGSATVRRSSPATQARRLSAVKSVLSFAQRIGHRAFKVGAPVRLPSIKGTGQNALSREAYLHRMLALEPNTHDVVLSG